MEGLSKGRWAPYSRFLQHRVECPSGVAADQMPNFPTQIGGDINVGLIAFVDLGTAGVIAGLAFLTIIAAVAIGGLIFGMLTPGRESATTRTGRARGWSDNATRDQCAILIATKNGDQTLTSTIGYAAANGVPVYVLSDGSDDRTVEVARATGAEVVDYIVNRGKPTTLHAGCSDLDLLDRYQYLTIIDDDTHLEPDFVDRSLEYFDGETSIVVGRTCTLWPRSLRWNAFVAYRAFAYWFYQLTIRTPQSWANALNCISGSNSTYRTDVLREVLVETTPYIVDDTYWVLETHRRKLGRIRYGPNAWAWIQDPTTIKDFYKQNLRWLWGTNQGIVGHRIGSSLVSGKPTVFEILYTILIAHWVTYLLGLPFLIYLAIAQGPAVALYLVLARWFLFYIFLMVASVQMRHYHLLLFAPALIVLDLLFRFIWIHSVVKTIQQPTVESCKWDSPARVAS